ncbi:MAG: hypothetical protein HOF19_13650 [Gammaproteobacteria bacterium]|nr:hypothetical protein [Gammaproteobacteria bacterium]MBT5442159.1 hypothetical protein [Gammaproteobacteria bacterium]MBT5792894.1 hypothetical protein [Gammaproteobacteria bacterium]MBT7530196.1 hypothetical protein [Gammaproteobacteria bacterium]MBT7795643.1 hypothetical protein [Gammaproteobacteria bacterium]
MSIIIMKPIHNLLAVLCGLCFTATSMAADELIIFPNAGQTGEQQEADKFACYGWAKNQSGFDPMAPPTTTAPPPKKEAKKGGTGKGMLRGAAIGGIVGGSDGAKKGAGAGAVMGTARRNDQKRSETKSQQDWEQEQVAIYSANRNLYNRNYGACLEGKNYTVR